MTFSEWADSWMRSDGRARCKRQVRQRIQDNQVTMTMRLMEDLLRQSVASRAAERNLVSAFTTHD